MYYQCSENKGADQLRSYCEADLRLCFRVGKNPVFSWRGSMYSGFNNTDISVKIIASFMRHQMIVYVKDYF